MNGFLNGVSTFLSRCKVNEGRTLIVGSKIYENSPKQDRRNLYADAIGIDMELGDGVDWVFDLEEQEQIPHDLGKFEHVECTSVLEHSRRPWLMAANIERLMVPGATIFVTVPWIWRYHPYDHDYYRFSRDGIRAIFPNIEWSELTLVCEGRYLKADKVPAIIADDMKYLARTETWGFGVKKGTA